MRNLFFRQIVMSNVPNSLETVWVEDFRDVVVEYLLVGEIIDGERELVGD